MDMTKRHANAICIICGKGYYQRPSKENCKCCSFECKEQYFFNRGDFRLIPYCKSKNISVADFITQLDKMHNVEMKSIKEISDELGIVRISIMRVCKRYGVKTRSISEDNYRRYSTMTKEQIKAQTKKANEKCRKLFKNPEWKEQQIKKLLLSQENLVSYPEKLFLRYMNEKGYEPKIQYGEGLAGFILDFAFPDIKLAIEIDGEYWHSLQKTIIKDKRREYFLTVKKGWNVIHIPAKAFTKNPEHYIWEVMQTIETLKIA